MSKQDSKAQPLFMERGVGCSLFLASLALYVATLSWTPFPGLPAKALLAQLGLGGEPGILDSLWGWLVRLAARGPWLSVAGWTGLFSAVCGAAGVGLLGRLMTRVSYRGCRELTQASKTREAQARRLSGLVAGLYLACCIPFWVVSTRSLPGSFHVLLLLLAAWFFSQYQQGGKPRHLGWLGATCGAGITEFATGLVLFPLVVFLAGRELYRRGILRARRPHLVFWGGLLAGLMLYPFNAGMLFLQGAPAELWNSPWHAWSEILQSQFRLITHVRYTPGSMLILSLSLVPWLMLFVMSRRCPWFYESDQVVLRVVFVGALLAVLYNAPFALWNLLGMGDLMVTPYVLQAACMGYMAGEFWILGECQALGKTSRAMCAVRRAASLFALLLPVGVMAGGVHNRPAADGRHGRDMTSAAREVLDRLHGRDILFSTGVLDDCLELAVWEREIPVRVVSAPQTPSLPYLRQLSRAFPEESLNGPLRQGNFGVFLDNLLLSDEGPGRIALIDMPDVFRGFGHLVPDGILYRLEPHADSVDLKTLVESQESFWARMEEMAAHPAPEANPARPYQNLLRLLASKVANNLGVLQAERGEEAGALETWRIARRIYPENLSVLLNLMELGRTRELPEAAELEMDWEKRRDKPEGERWALAIRFGYVWHAHEWVRRGWVWVLSGAPTVDEASRRDPSAADEEPIGRERLFDQAYLQWGSAVRDENHYRMRLMQDGKDTSALMALCRLALRRKDGQAAEAYMAEALSLGLPEEAVSFDRAMAAYVRGDRDKAVAALEAVTRLVPGDARGWMALVLLTDEQDPRNRVAMRTLKNHPSAGVGGRLALAWVHMSRQQWTEAQAELEAAVQLVPRNSMVWEMMVSVAQARGNPALAEASLRTLLANHPGHPFRHIQKASGHVQRREFAEAEAELRSGLRQERNPDLLNELARIIMKKNGDLPEAFGLVEEALRERPFHPTFRCTRIELNLMEGNPGEAERDLQAVLQDTPGHVQALVLTVWLHALRGEEKASLDLARTLARRGDELTPEQRALLKTWILRIRNK
jgi:tetratricopeptide (TPR) repeat protein